MNRQILRDLIAIQEGKLEVEIDAGAGLGDHDVRASSSDVISGHLGTVEELVAERGEIALRDARHHVEKVLGRRVLELVFVQIGLDALPEGLLPKLIHQRKEPGRAAAVYLPVE